MILGRRDLVELLSSVSSDAYAHYYCHHTIARTYCRRHGLPFYLDDALPWVPRAGQRYADAEFEGRTAKQGLRPMWLGEK